MISGKSPGVLVVDDLQTDAELTVHALNTCRAHPVVTWLSSQEEALLYMFRAGPYAGCKTALPKLVILNVEIPGIDGMRVLRQLKRDKRTACTPIAVLSSCDDAPIIRQCYELGANSYIVKPISAAAHFQKVAAAAQYWLELNAHTVEPTSDRNSSFLESTAVSARANGSRVLSV